MVIRLVYLIIILATTAYTHKFKGAIKCHKNKTFNTFPICLTHDYKKDVAPIISNTLNISIILEIHDITDVNDKDATVTITTILFISWIDSRLKLIHDSKEWNQNQNGSQWCHLNILWLDYLWVPDMDILHIKSFRIKISLE